nr:unnamed protein product [Digitaria exilis]
MAKKGGAGERKVEAPPLETEGIVWREDAGRFETPDGEAFLQYRLPSPAVMDMGLAARLCDISQPILVRTIQTPQTSLH